MAKRLRLLFIAVLALVIMGVSVFITMAATPTEDVDTDSEIVTEVSDDTDTDADATTLEAVAEALTEEASEYILDDESTDEDAELTNIEDGYNDVRFVLYGEGQITITHGEDTYVVTSDDMPSDRDYRISFPIGEEIEVTVNVADGYYLSYVALADDVGHWVDFMDFDDEAVFTIEATDEYILTAEIIMFECDTEEEDVEDDVESDALFNLVAAYIEQTGLAIASSNTMSTSGITASLAAPSTVTVSSRSLYSWSKSDGTTYGYGASSYTVTASGSTYIAFCMQHNKAGVSASTVMSVTSCTDQTPWKILYYTQVDTSYLEGWTYWSTYSGWSTAKQRSCVALALSCYYGNTYSNNKYAASLASYAATLDNIVAHTIKFSTTSRTAYSQSSTPTWDTSASWYQKTSKVSYTANKDDVTFTLGKTTNGDTVYMKVTTSDGDTTTYTSGDKVTLTNGDKFWFEASAEASGTLTVSVSVDYTWADMYKATYSSSYQSVLFLLDPETKTASASLEVTFAPITTYSLSMSGTAPVYVYIKKTDANGNGIDGAVFLVEDDQGNSCTITSGSNSSIAGVCYATFTYSLRDTVNAYDYMDDDSRATAYATMCNNYLLYVLAKGTWFDSSGTSASTITYTITEISAPEGYEISTETKTVTVNVRQYLAQYGYQYTDGDLANGNLNSSTSGKTTTCTWTSDNDATVTVKLSSSTYLCTVSLSGWGTDTRAFFGSTTTFVDLKTPEISGLNFATQTVPIYKTDLSGNDVDNATFDISWVSGDALFDGYEDTTYSVTAGNGSVGYATFYFYTPVTYVYCSNWDELSTAQQAALKTTYSTSNGYAFYTSESEAEAAFAEYVTTISNVYSITETSAPDGYILDTNTYYFKVTGAGEGTTIVSPTSIVTTDKDGNATSYDRLSLLTNTFTYVSGYAIDWDAGYTVERAGSITTSYSINSIFSSNIYGSTLTYVGSSYLDIDDAERLCAAGWYTTTSYYPTFASYTEGYYFVLVNSNYATVDTTTMTVTTFGFERSGTNAVCYKFTFNVVPVYSTAEEEFNVLAFANAQACGYAKLTKLSSDSSITDGNSNYSLSGATYAVYTDSSCKTAALLYDSTEKAIFTTNSDGESDIICLEPGTYYVKETATPQGYELNDTVYKLTVTNNNTEDNPAYVGGSDTAVEDSPELVTINVTKLSVNDEITDNNNCYSLEGAVYGVWYTNVASEMDDVSTAADSLDTSSDYYITSITTTAVTNSDGTISYVATLTDVPYGYYYVKEMESSTGFILDEELHYVDATYGSSELTAVSASGYTITKISSGSTTLVDGDVIVSGDAYVVNYVAGDYLFTDYKSISYDSSGNMITSNGTSLSGVTFADLPTGTNFYIVYSTTKIDSSLTVNAYMLYVEGSGTSYLYYLDKVTLTATAGDTTKYNAYVTSYETPGNDPIGITVYKEIEYAEDDELQLAEDYWSDMSGAIFKVTYYGGQYTLDEIKNGQATKDGVVTRTWYITTKSKDEDGNTFYDDDGNIVYRAELTEYYLVNDDEYTSDELFYLDGEVAYPIGTYTIEEVATPDGYTATGEYYDEDGELVESANEVAVIRVTYDDDIDSGGELSTGNIYEKSEVPEYGSLTIYKKDSDGNNLSDVTFLVEIWNEDATNEDGGSWDAVTSVTTDENGTATVTHLVFGTYRVTETKTQPGLTLLAEPMIFTIDSVENKNQYYDVLNGITFSMPMTGESGFTVLPFIMVGMVIAAVGVYMVANKRRRYSHW